MGFQLVAQVYRRKDQKCSCATLQCHVAQEDPEVKPNGLPDSCDQLFRRWHEPRGKNHVARM